MPNYKETIGLTESNQDIRLEQLRRSKGVYPLSEMERITYTPNGSHAGSLVFKTTLPNPKGEYDNILDYTQESGLLDAPQYRGVLFTDDAAELNEETPLSSLWAYNNDVYLENQKYEDYREYVNEVYDLSDVVFDIQARVVGDQYHSYLTDNNMKALFMNESANEVAVFDRVRAFKNFPTISKVESETVNPNNSYDDTIHGKINNLLNVYNIHNAILANDKRDVQYITPSLRNYLGFNSRAVGSDGSSKLSDLWNAEILPTDSDSSLDNVKVITYDEYEDDTNIKKGDVEKALKSGDFNYTTKSNRYSPVKDNEYLEYVGLSGTTYSVGGKQVNIGTVGKFEEKRLDGLSLTTYNGIYNEGDSDSDTKPSISAQEKDWNYTEIPDSINGNDLLTKTKKLFNHHVIDTLVSRFKTGHKDNDSANIFDGTIDTTHGHSHGRNLLRLDENNRTHGYSNPYCRTWTWHHSYGKLGTLIRESSPGEFKYAGALKPFRTQSGGEYNRMNGIDYLNNNTVLMDNGFVRITPHNNSKDGYKEEIKKCMFSIENLAWKGSKEFEKMTNDQKGDNGGRIMWFPPYNINFNETSNVEWSTNTFIGRGENVFTYTDTTRTAELSFDILIDYPTEANKYKNTEGNDETDYELLSFFYGRNMNGEKKYGIREKVFQQEISQNKESKNNTEGYGNEYEYFKKVEKDSKYNFARQQIVDKVKLFTPVFHSISPEGFNARLTFLQQCTRQGPTNIGSTNGYAKPATNLSFGRMPVCVLRIGDFINTRIIVNSVGISYSNGSSMSWDMNPEGIGLQPMFARVTMTIMLLGGQSLTGPINRLQNAVTFDYYANTGVYEYRAEQKEEDSFWVPNVQKSKTK